MRRLFAALAAGALLAGAGASTAPAQNTGTRIGRDARPGSAEDAARAAEILAQCFVERRPEIATRWLRLLPGTLEERRLIAPQADDLGLCMDRDPTFVLIARGVRFRAPALRAPVALALVRRGIERAPDRSPLPRDAEPWFLRPLNAHPAAAPVDRVTLMGQDFGHCVVLSEFAGARALLSSRSGSPEEEAALRRLGPVLGGCLVQGMRLNATPGSLRLYLAEPFYHIVQAAAPAAGR